MNRIKDGLYNLSVRQNGRIWYEYERFVRENIADHAKHRLRHFIVLIKLNWFYRVRKGNTPYLYWDTPLDPNGITQNDKTFQITDETTSKIAASKPLQILKTGNSSNDISQFAESGKFNATPAYFIAKSMMKYDVISFDVFDTLLMRPFSSPRDVFFLVGEKLGIDEFRRIRAEAETEARDIALAISGCREVKIRDIYEVINRHIGLDIDYGIQTEIEIEMNLCFANPRNKDVYDILRHNGKRIILTTDMYLPSTVIQKMLDENGIEGYEKLFVSCEWMGSKRTGALYQSIRKYLDEHCYKEESQFKANRNGNTPLSIIHIGDNKETDILAANQQGWVSKYYRNVNLAGATNRPNNMSELIGSAYVGTVNARLHNGKDSYSPNYEYGYTAGGIYVFGYMNWVNEVCKERNIDKIIFLARDGYIYKKVYDQYFNEIPNCYCRWSRVASIFSGASTNRGRSYFIKRALKDRVNPVLQTEPSTFREIMNDFELSQLTDMASLEELNVDVVVTKDNLRIFESFLIRNWTSVMEAYEGIMQQLKAYISKTITNCKRVAIVDVGWNGSGPLMLKELFREWGIEVEPLCLVAGHKTMNRTSAPVDKLQQGIHEYLFSDSFNRANCNAFKKKGVYAPLFELFTQSREPSFSYIREDGTYQFEVPEVENYKVVREIHQGIMDFCDDYYTHFASYPYMFRISGHDAFCPFMKRMTQLEYFEKTMGNVVLMRTVKSSSGRYSGWKLKRLIEEAKG